MNDLRRGCCALVLMALTLVTPMSQADEPVLDVAWPFDVGPLDSQGYGANQMMAQAMVYEPLVRFHDGKIEPWLATDWDISDDGRTYVFTLRDGVRFSDGAPFDARAVKANVDAVLQCRDRHDWLALVNKIERVEVRDARTVALVLKTPYYPTLMELSLIRPLRFASPGVLQTGSEHGDAGARTGQDACRLSRPIGTGPWVFSRREPGRVDHFTRNPTYWGTAPAYAGVDIHIINDPNTRAVALETGKVDLVQGTRGLVSSDSFQRFTQDPRFNARASKPLATRTFVINASHGPTRDVRVRRAIEHAIDTDAMRTSLLFDTEPKADALFSSDVPYADVALTPYAFDPNKARTLLDNAGWVRGKNGLRSKDGTPLTLDAYFVGDDPLQKALSQVMQANLADIGIQVRLHGEEETALMQRERNGGFDLVYSDTWGAPYEPHAYLSSMRVPAHADYQAQKGLADKAELDRAIARVLTLQDETERRALYHDILTRLHEAAIYVPITHVTSRSVSRPDVDNVQFGDTLEDVPFARMRPARDE
ncbi:nickel ABC transporter substrate-binding protein [Larsenimonas suaedae]|uniref:Nickel ABC transporter substrate-binding protein n=1 Tax=Larsenimonas suaedae TaxID=1851019 RepID=A0ABU1GRV9_9GAMM|nr:nickel ABC transporter substrate-binding protein [Larsenimonas suaedae]MCM2972454.1 nickel ABC transporter substrate-binding protein [Larsenimonas suaedae]MDR5894750.1 nickel ABC transporter substrate-binding protein [Larsenimonas suaedae]